ncbi:MAG: beta-propeller fold lactonase family protein [Acidobacteria bacterium]|nr:beta-propeller fold lactonase family protein [Acidobacteriota bacterium]
MAVNRERFFRLSSRLSRREILAGAGVLAAAAGAKAQKRSGGELLAYVGAITDTLNGKGIYTFKVDLESGALEPLESYVSGDRNPSWLAFHPAGTHLYAANSVSTVNGHNGSVSAFAIDASSGGLKLLNTVDAKGSGSTHCSVHPSGDWLFVANYGAGNAAVLPIRPDRTLGEATDVASIPVDPPALGKQPAADAPAGSYAISGHDSAHAHQIGCDPAGNFVFLTDLATDRTLVFAFDSKAGKLTPNTPPAVKEAEGAGPRHFAFHPNGKYFYVINEEASTMTFMTYDAAKGVLTPRQTLPTLPPDFVGTTYTSEVVIAADGRHVYGLNRLHDTIAIFRVGGDGRLTFLGEEWTRADYPRHAAIEPTGKFLYVCNDRGDSITRFRIQGGGQRLEFAGYTPVRIPSFIGFRRLP